MQFQEVRPSLDSYWRSVILFGSNSASYKFALAKSLLGLVDEERTSISLEELAVPFSREIAQHLVRAERQGTSRSSSFLEACRKFNKGEVSQDELIATTVKLGFANVLDAFHHVDGADLKAQFFTKSGRTWRAGVTITDDLLALKRSYQKQNLPDEAEARWRLVETAWQLNISSNLLEVSYQPELDQFSVAYAGDLRVPITSSRPALNGYQQGKCFYCYRDISIVSGSPDLAQVDHFLPLAIEGRNRSQGLNFNGVWNLVLACKPCNQAKSDILPEERLLQRLHKRNSYLINSHHPLRETLIRQTGATEPERLAYLKGRYKTATEAKSTQRWSPAAELERAF